MVALRTTTRTSCRSQSQSTSPMRPFANLPPLISSTTLKINPSRIDSRSLKISKKRSAINSSNRCFSSLGWKISTCLMMSMKKKTTLCWLNKITASLCSNLQPHNLPKKESWMSSIKWSMRTARRFTHKRNPRLQTAQFQKSKTRPQITGISRWTITLQKIFRWYSRGTPRRSNNRRHLKAARRDNSSTRMLRWSIELSRMRIRLMDDGWTTIRRTTIFRSRRRWMWRGPRQFKEWERVGMGHRKLRARLYNRISH